MKLRYLLVIGSLSLVTLGYCAGRCSHRTEHSPQQPSSLETSIHSPEHQQLHHSQEQSQQQQTPQETLLEFLASRPSLPLAPPSPLQQPSSFTDDYRSFLKTMTGCARELYQRVHQEAVHCYDEAKEYLQRKREGK